MMMEVSMTWSYGTKFQLYFWIFKVAILASLVFEEYIKNMFVNIIRENYGNIKHVFKWYMTVWLHNVICILHRYHSSGQYV